MPTITLEEHFVTSEFLHATHQDGTDTPPQVAALRPRLLEIGAGRIAAMDEAAVDVQVLSLAALGMEALDRDTATAVFRGVNDELAQAVQANPNRLAGFATLALKDPASAAKEFERCVTKLGFVGALVDGTSDGLFLDNERFLPVWEAAASLRVPVYLHPAPPPTAVMESYYTGLPGELGRMLSIAGWGWHAELGLHTLRLIVSGLFDRFPELQLIIGHMGEGLPYALARSSLALSHTPGARLRQPVSEYFQSNIHITTSGYFTQPPLHCALEVVGLDRLMFSVDYPFSPTTRGRSFLDDAAKTLSPEELRKLAGGNAEQLLRLSMPPV